MISPVTAMIKRFYEHDQAGELLRQASQPAIEETLQSVNYLAVNYEACFSTPSQSGELLQALRFDFIVGNIRRAC